MTSAAPCVAAFSDFQIFVEIGVFLLELGELLVKVGQTLGRCFVGLFLKRLALDLELDDAPLEPVHRLGLRVDFDTDTRRGLVDEIDRLVRQLPVADVAVRQRGRRDDRRVGDLDAVVYLVAFLEAAQDRDCVFDRRLVDQHLLEAPLQRRVLLHVLAILIERCRADAMQLAARQRRFQHVAGVHGALGLAGPDHRVQLVDKEDHLAFLLGEIIEQRLQPLLELAAEFGAGD